MKRWMLNLNQCPSFHLLSTSKFNLMTILSHRQIGIYRAHQLKYNNIKSTINSIASFQKKDPVSANFMALRELIQKANTHIILTSHEC